MRYEIYETAGKDRAEFAILDTAQVDGYGAPIAICYIHVTKDVSKDYETRLSLARDIADGVVRDREEQRFASDFEEIEQLIDDDEWEEAKRSLEDVAVKLGYSSGQVVRLRTLIGLMLDH